MLIHSAKFIKSSTSIKQCDLPAGFEFGFIGRSNVGKSSLINMLTGHSHLAKTSGNPGKTRTINHFLINGEWYLVDLPGYGFARVPQKLRKTWIRSTEEYLLERDSLVCLFVLIDSRIAPQDSDLKFMEFLGVNNIPFARVFTKTDKLSALSLQKAVELYDAEMLNSWESLPPTFIASAVNKAGREEILNYIEETINNLSKRD